MNYKSIFSTVLFASIMTSTPAMAGGEEIYTKTCAMCHATGLAESPKLGDKSAWSPRIALGIDALVASATKGKGSMPPKGSCNSCSTAELKSSIEYMISKSQ